VAASSPARACWWYLTTCERVCGALLSNLAAEAEAAAVVNGATVWFQNGPEEPACWVVQQGPARGIGLHVSSPVALFAARGLDSGRAALKCCVELQTVQVGSSNSTSNHTASE
jgi:hypothetical protein